VVGDARYRSIRGPFTPTVYVPFSARTAGGALAERRRGTFVVRSAGADPLALAAMLRQEVPRVQPGFRVSTVRTQAALNASHRVRERLLATLGLFFAVVALTLSGVGLYGVPDYSVPQRRREIGIRIAIGAGEIARRVIGRLFAMIAVGGCAGLLPGIASARTLETLFYDVKASDPAMLALPWMALLAAALLAAAAPVLRATRINPVTMLRSD